jgi:hypothetical protein
MPGLVLVLSHRDHRSWAQYQQRPQPTNEETTTRSPTAWRRTPEPVSTTSPRNSWPMTSPERMKGM